MNQQGNQLIVKDIKWKTLFIYKVEVALVSRDIFFYEFAFSLCQNWSKMQILWSKVDF